MNWLKKNKNMLKIVKREIKAALGLGNKPDFLILGAQKSGTTSLFKYIQMYAKNFDSPVSKEIQYFTQRYDKPLSYYYAHFPQKKKNRVTGEASPTYLFYHKVPERVKKAGLHDLKFIVILRDPVDRAFSHYNFLNNTNRTDGYDPLSFQDAIKQEEARLSINDESEFTYEYKKYSYKSRGLYHLQLLNWFKYFDKEKFLILELKEFEQNPKQKLIEIFEFLNLEPNETFHDATFPVFNKNKYDAIPKDAEEYLINYFKEPNQKLFDLLNVKYDWKN